MDKIKAILAELLAILAFVTFGWLQLKNRAAEQIQRETEQQARELKQQADKALQDGLANEQHIREEVVNNPHQRVNLD